MHEFQQILDLDIAYPLIQSPMAGVQDAGLAVAVAVAGALGSLPCAMLKPAQLEAALTELSVKTSKPINLNFFCHQEPQPDPAIEAQWQQLLQPYYDELGITLENLPNAGSRKPFNHVTADILEANPPAVISFHFGLPDSTLVNRVKKLGCKILSSATTVAEAQWLEEHGADAIIAQGIEAGGHRGMFLSTDLGTQLSTSELTCRILQSTTLPVISAGGIATASEVTAMLELGASAVQVGTSYLCSDEANTSSGHRAALMSATADDIQVTNLLTGRPARGISNRLMKELGPLLDFAPAFPLAANALVPLRRAAEKQGNYEFSPLWSGTNTTGVASVPAAEITRNLVSQLGQ